FDPALGDTILPRTAVRGSNRFAAQGFEHLGCFSCVLTVSIEDEVTRCSIFGKRLSHLLRDLLTRGMFGGIEMEDSPPAVADDEEAVEHAEHCSRHREEVHGRDRLAMILKKGRPEPAGIFSTAAQRAKITRHRALGNL